MTPAAAAPELETPAESGGGFVKVTRKLKRLFREAPRTWLPVWEELELKLWHRQWRRVAASEVAEECGMCVRTVKRVFHAFEVLGILNIRHTKGGSYKNTCWLQLCELPKELVIPESLRRTGERERLAEKHAGAPASAEEIQEAAAQVFLGELAATAEAAPELGRAEQLWALVFEQLRDNARTFLERAHARAISRGMLVLEVEQPDYIAEWFGTELRYWGRQNGVDDVVLVAPGVAWPPVEAAAPATDEPLAEQALRMVREYFTVMHGVPAELAAGLQVGAGLTRADVELATGLLEMNGAAAWNYVNNACALLARQSQRGATFKYLIPHLARVGARWPGQDAPTPAGIRRARVTAAA